MPKIPTFHIKHLPEGNYWNYRKTKLTSAIRIDGPFIVETSEGPLRCNDGYLAIDARGYPYPIDKEEFELIYELDLKRF